MSRSKRIEVLESINNPKRAFCFTVRDNRAKGHGWYEGAPTYENLNQEEYETAVKELEAEGVEVITLNIIAVGPGGSERGPWA